MRSFTITTFEIKTLTPVELAELINKRRKENGFNEAVGITRRITEAGTEYYQETPEQSRSWNYLHYWLAH